MAERIERTGTPSRSGLKRGQPESPDGLSPNIKQTERQTRARQDSDNVQQNVSNLPTIVETSGKGDEINTVDSETVVKLSNVVISTLSNTTFIDSIIPMISKHVIKYIQSTVDDMVAESVRTQTEPLIKQIEDNHHTIKCQSDQIAKQSVEIQTLRDKINKIDEVENRIEEQEQYSRRTSLRFNNVPAPVDNKGQIIMPINTDQLVLDICNKNLKQSISIEDIGRSHPIGETKNGKISVIARFLSYRKRQLVYSNKRALKDNPNKTFITENLTKKRYGLIKQLGELKYQNKIHAFWTHDGTILVKQTQSSRIMPVRSQDDIAKLS